MNLPGLTYTDILKSWLPWLSFFGLVWKFSHKIKEDTENLAGSLLDNHLAHLQESLTNIENLLKQLVEK